MLKTPAPIDTRLYLKYYDLGYTDSAIADQINCNAKSVWIWRKKNNLPSNFKRLQDKLPLLTATIKNNGNFDILYLRTGIKERLGWRNGDKLLLEIKDKQLIVSPSIRRTQQKVKEIDETRAMQLYEKGKKDKEIACELDLNMDYVARWRNKHQLPPN